MTLQAIGGMSVPYGLPAFPRISSNDAPAFNSSVIDAAGEMICMIGSIWFAAGPGTSKTFSSAGGNIQFRTGTVTWASAGSTVRVGIQNVSTSAGPPARCVEDWTTGSPPYDDLVQGTDTVSSNTWTTATMSAGSRTLAHGDLVAVTWDMTTRNGADSVTLTGFTGISSSVNQRPVWTTKTGGSWAAAVIVPNVVITCDDGTLCFIAGGLPASSVTTRTYNNGTATADEYGNIVTPGGKMGTDELWAQVAPVGDFDVILYSDALNVTAPTSEQSVSVDLNAVTSTTSGLFRLPIGQETLTASSAYAVTVRPTSATSISMIEVGVSAAGHLAGWPGGTGMYKCTRLDAGGALSTTTTARMLTGFSINQIDDGAGGGSVAYPVSGAMR